MTTLYNEMNGVATSATLIDDMSRRNSTHPIQCALWGFFGGDTILENPYRPVHPDKMHQFDLGLFKTLISILKVMAVEVLPVTFKRKALQILDQRLAWVAEHHRYPEFRLPACKGRTGYFTSNATFQAFEHRCVFQVIIPLLIGVYQTPVLQVVMSMWDWYTLAFRTSVHSEETLSQMDRLMFVASNKKDFAKQMTNHHQRLLALSRKNTASNFEFEKPDERYTALDKAVTSRSNILMGSRLHFRMEWLQRVITDIPLNGREFLTAQPEIVLHLITAIQAFCATNDLHTVETFEIKIGVAIAVGVRDRFADWPKTGRSTPSFHGAPYFSDVAIQMEGEGKGPLTSYAQLRLLFSCPVIASSGERATRDLAFVRWYECNTRPERTTGCLILKPVVDRIEIGRHSRQPSSRRRVAVYDVVEVANILRVVHLVPHYGVDKQESGEFLLNRFKF